MEWSDALSIGIPEIDDQHRTFIELVNRLGALCGEPAASRRDLRVLLADLVTYAEHHFVAEEEHMVAAGYPRAAEHAGLHDAAARRIHDLLIRDAGETELYGFLGTFLKGWLASHIMGEDKDFGEWLRRLAPVDRSARRTHEAGAIE